MKDFESLKLWDKVRHIPSKQVLQFYRNEQGERFFITNYEIWRLRLIRSGEYEIYTGKAMFLIYSENYEICSNRTEEELTYLENVQTSSNGKEVALKEYLKQFRKDAKIMIEDFQSKGIEYHGTVLEYPNEKYGDWIVKDLFYDSSHVGKTGIVVDLPTKP